ncbi:hypothetical protein ONE63_004418 [Megalurothrips usitatus]|uniref:Uncharacterized protein n=1 Tax=Megalurothrips usitatus TaxID=439358 RepID=A0AAV7X703_9NEOP|nr:hypothetical protein ONE63_004418 [Megalurothrips usitatus]KAJ1520208.1 hypothetical protein ONE63_004418 [Megalurothrips usitatus]
MAENNLHCKVCFEDYNENERRPKILSNCGHTFCLECISGFFKSSPSPECPLCRNRVGVYLHELKDNYELMEFLPTKIDKAPKFFCEVCDQVATYHCVNNHSIRNIASVAAEKIVKSKENLQKKLQEERSLLNEAQSGLRSTLQAIRQSVVDRLECELDWCQKRMEYLNHLPEDFDVAQQTVSRNGDLHLLSVFDLFDNKDECALLHKAIEAHAEAMKIQLTLHSKTHQELSFSLGQSSEDQALAFLITILLDNQTQSTNSTVVKTNWLPRPWLTKLGVNSGDIHSIRNSVASLQNPCNESATSEVSQAEVSREIYVGGIKSCYASLKALQDIFSPHGKIKNIVLRETRGKGKTPSFAFIEFEDDKTAVCVLNKKDLFDRMHGLKVRPKITGKTQNKGQPQLNSVVFQNSQQTQIVPDLLDEQQELAQRMLFIQNVPVDFPEHRISELLSKYGPIEDVRKQVKTEGKISRAFAFVTFVHMYSAQNALKEPAKRIVGGPGIVLEYRAYHPRPNDSDIRNAENITLRPNSTKSATKPSMCTTSTVPKSTISPSTTVQATTATSSSIRPTTSTAPSSRFIRPLMSIPTPTLTGPPTSINSSPTVAKPSTTAFPSETRPPMPPRTTPTRPPLPAKTVIRPPASADTSSAAVRPTPLSSTSSVLIRPVSSISTSRPATTPNPHAASRTHSYTPTAPPMPRGKNEKECVIQ